MIELSECQAACKNDMICVNQCFLALGEKNEFCPCGKFCDSNVNFFKLYFIIFLSKFALGGCPCLDCENCWDCSIPTECSSKDEEKKVFSSIYRRKMVFFHIFVDRLGHFYLVYRNCA